MSFKDPANPAEKVLNAFCFRKYGHYILLDSIKPSGRLLWPENEKIGRFRPIDFLWLQNGHFSPADGH